MLLSLKSGLLPWGSGGANVSYTVPGKQSGGCGVGVGGGGEVPGKGRSLSVFRRLSSGGSCAAWGLCSLLGIG